MDNNKIIHLFVLEKCTHTCELCCNKQYPVESIPVVTVEELKYADTICLTGGEPFLLHNICRYAGQIKAQYPNIKNIYVYTCGDSLKDFLTKYLRLFAIDGVSICPKNKYDAGCVTALYTTNRFRVQLDKCSSNRLYVLPEVKEYLNLKLFNSPNLEIIDREWQEDFKAQSGIFRRLPILL